MSIKRGSRVAINVSGSIVYGLVVGVTNDKARVALDDGRAGKIALASLKESNQPLPADHPSRKFKAGDRIQWRKSGTMMLGVVRASDRFGFLEVDADDGTSWSGVSAGGAEASDAPLPDHMKAIPAPLKKGDRVEFKGDGGTMLYGVVSKVGKRVEVVQDGGDVVHSGYPSAFKPSDHPLRKGPPDAMDRWSVVSYKAHPKLSEETECFEAMIALDGHRIIEASNRGQGGCGEFHPMVGASRDALTAFEKDAKDWAARHDPRADKNDFSEPMSDWLRWATHSKDYGVTASDFFEKRHRDLDEMTAGRFSMTR